MRLKVVRCKENKNFRRLTDQSLAAPLLADSAKAGGQTTSSIRNNK
jgi:hypothetical protein